VLELVLGEDGDNRSDSVHNPTDNSEMRGNSGIVQRPAIMVEQGRRTPGNPERGAVSTFGLDYSNAR
jgi:hypothetical protein